MFVCTRAELAPRTSFKVLGNGPGGSFLFRQISCITAALFALSLGGCINPKQLGHAEQSETIVGRVLDKTTGEAILGATISDEMDRQANTNSQGTFSFALPNGAHDLIIHAQGYRSAHVHIARATQPSVLITPDGYVRLEPSNFP